MELALLLVKEACQLVLGPWGRSIFRFHNYGRKRKSFLHLFQTWGKLSKVPRASPSWKMDWNMRQFFFCFSGPLLQVLVACLDRLADQAFLVCVTRWISKTIVPKSRKTRIRVSIDDVINHCPSPENPKGDDVCHRSKNRWIFITVSQTRQAQSFSPEDLVIALSALAIIDVRDDLALSVLTEEAWGVKCGG